MGLSEQRVGSWRLSLEQIEATVADHLGRGRVPGNHPGPSFSRQVAMYLARNVAGWSTTRIGRFYNGRHHTTVLYAIAKIERLRQTDETFRRIA
jgi:chromosomal replication initiator protein